VTTGGRGAARFRRNRGAVIGAWLIGALLLFAVIAPLASSHAPNASDFAAGIDPGGLPVGPTAAHPLGTDALFRDELSRLSHGARLSLTIALLATAISTTIGAAVGVVAGYVAGTSRGVIDALLMRFVDVLLSFPYLLLVMAIGAALEDTSVATVLWVLGLTSWLGTARLVRAKTMQVRELGFVEAARALGQTTPRILVSHVLPNIAGPLVVISTVGMSSMILAESVLSYLQVGIQPPTATWGRMLYEGQHSFTLQPRLVVAPGFCILLSVLGFNLLGEGLRDAMDPRDSR
jgi:ABC-type dipeptide/oligopeptide/nickel transport system permease subunit